MCSDRSDNFALCEFYYLSRLIGNAGLTQNMFEGLQDLCSSQVCFKRLNFLQSLVRGLLGVLYTFTDNVHSINTHGKILYWYFHWSIQLNINVSTFKLCDLVITSFSFLNSFDTRQQLCYLETLQPEGPPEITTNRQCARKQAT